MVTLSQAKQIRLEEVETTIGGKVGDVLRNFNTGLARTLGIPRALTDLNEQLGGTIFGDIGHRLKGDERINILPTAEQIQEFGSKPGLDITFPPNEEPDTLMARTTQNIGAAAPILAFLPLTASILGIEAGASFAAAGGGKLLEQTEFGRKHPELARGIGELGGGFGLVFSIPLAQFLVRNKGFLGLVLKFIKKVLPRSEKRVLTKLGETVSDPQTALRELKKAERIPEEKLLSTAEVTGSRGLAQLGKAVEEEVPKVAAIIEKTRIQSINQLQKQFNRTGNVADASLLIEEKLILALPFLRISR